MVWDVTSGQCLKTLTGGTPQANSAAQVGVAALPNAASCHVRPLAADVLATTTAAARPAQSNKRSASLSTATGAGQVRRRAVEAASCRTLDDGDAWVWVDCDEAKMARLVALRRLYGMNVDHGWRLIDNGSGDEGRGARCAPWRRRRRGRQVRVLRPSSLDGGSGGTGGTAGARR